MGFPGKKRRLTRTTPSTRKHWMAIFGYATRAALLKRSEDWITRYGDALDSIRGPDNEGEVGDAGDVGDVLRVAGEPTGLGDGVNDATDLKGMQRT